MDQGYHPCMLALREFQTVKLQLPPTGYQPPENFYGSAANCLGSLVPRKCLPSAIILTGDRNSPLGYCQFRKCPKRCDKATYPGGLQRSSVCFSAATFPHGGAVRMAVTRRIWPRVPAAARRLQADRAGRTRVGRAATSIYIIVSKYTRGKIAGEPSHWRGGIGRRGRYGGAFLHMPRPRRWAGATPGVCSSKAPARPGRISRTTVAIGIADESGAAYPPRAVQSVCLCSAVWVRTCAIRRGRCRCTGFNMHQALSSADFWGPALSLHGPVPMQRHPGNAGATVLMPLEKLEADTASKSQIAAATKPSDDASDDAPPAPPRVLGVRWCGPSRHRGLA
jgi:hypothetical protein